MSNPNNAKFPKITADYTDLPNGDKVWVQTASELQLDDIREEASWYAREKTEPYRKGNSRYRTVVADMKELDAENQAILIAQAGYFTGEFRRIIDEEFPAQSKPIRDKDDTDEEFMKRQDAYLVKEEELENAREAKAKFLFEDRKQNALALSPQKRLAEAVDRAISQRYSKYFDRGYTMHLLYTVVRLSDDHDERYFKNPQQLEDSQWEDARVHLVRFYNEKIDTVKQDEIPT
jgi:hypothetical protein